MGVSSTTGYDMGSGRARMKVESFGGRGLKARERIGGEHGFGSGGVSGC